MGRPPGTGPRDKSHLKSSKHARLLISGWCVWNTAPVLERSLCRRLQQAQASQSGWSLEMGACSQTFLLGNALYDVLYSDAAPWISCEKHVMTISKPHARKTCTHAGDCLSLSLPKDATE
jgi:hypothetical protein